MQKRGGFTLIELLIVIVIIGILAAIAVPKLTKTRERAYFKTVSSDLRTLGTQQELYFALPDNQFSYAPTTALLVDYDVSPGVLVQVVDATTHGWSATATHAGLIAAHQECGIYHGVVASPPPYVRSAGVVSCTGM